MSDQEEGEIFDSGGEEEQTLPTTSSQKSGKIANIMDVDSSNVPSDDNSTGRKDTFSPPKKGNNGRQFNNDNYRKPRRLSKPPPNAFNEISNSKQKFVSRRVSESRFTSPPPSNRTHYDPSFNTSYASVPSNQTEVSRPFNEPPIHSGYASALPNLTEVSVSRPSDSWRQDTMMLTVSPRRGPLLPPPFLSQTIPSSQQPSFFNQPPIRSSFAPPTYRPSIPNQPVFCNIPQSSFGPLAARHSVDMEISPLQSPMGTVMIVDEPLEENSPPPPDTADENLSGNVVTDTVEPPIPYIVEHGMYIPQDEVVNVHAEEPPPTVTAEENQPAAEIPATVSHTTQKVAESIPTQSQPKQRQKKFSKDLLKHIKSALLESLDDDSSSSSSSEFEEEAKEIGELKRRLLHHNKEMHDELDKRERLVKEMNSCQLMINHHYERMNTIMRSIGELSRQSVRQVRRSLSRTKSDGRKKRQMLFNNFENRVAAVLNELSVMDEEVIVSAPQEPPEKSNETFDFAEVLGIEDSGVEFSHSMDATSLAAAIKPPPKRIEKQLVVDKGFQNECLRRMMKARYGIQPLPHIVVEPSRPPANDIPVKKKSSNTSANPNLQREEAMRRKLLEQMKKKEQLFPSLHENNKDARNEKRSINQMDDNEMEVVEEVAPPLIEEPAATVPESSYIFKPFKLADVATVPETTKEVVNSSNAFKLFKPADVTTVPVAAAAAIVPEERPIIVPTMKDILEMKKEVNMALSKRRSLRKQGLTSSSSSKSTPLKPNSDASASSKTSTPVKAPLPKPVEKENIANIQVNPMKRSAPSENTDLIKKARPLPEEKSQCLDETEMRELDILFNSPRVAVRNFILLPEYPIKESIERLRHRADADIEMCYFQIFGVCMDDECPYQHQRDFTLNDQQILEEILGYIPQRKTRSESIQKQAQKLLQSNSLEEIIESLRKEASCLDLINLAVESSV